MSPWRSAAGPTTSAPPETAHDPGSSPASRNSPSAHLKVLAEVRFVLVDRLGNARYYRINPACVSCFPTAADVVMGHPAPAQPGATTCETSDLR